MTSSLYIHDKPPGEIEFDGRSDDSSEADESEDAETNVPEEKTYSLSAALGMDSHFNLWNSVVDSKCEHENVDADPGHMPTPVDDVAGRRRVKIVTQKLVSVYNPTLRRPVLQQYLCGQGQRMGNTLIITTPESTSSFTEKLPDHLKKLNVLNPPQTAGPSSGIGPTPSMAFSCDDDPCAFAWVDESLAALLTEKGGDVEEIMLEVSANKPTRTLAVRPVIEVVLALTLYTRVSDSGRIQKIEFEFGQIRRTNSNSRIRITLEPPGEFGANSNPKCEFGNSA